MSGKYCLRQNGSLAMGAIGHLYNRSSAIGMIGVLLLMLPLTASWSSEGESPFLVIVDESGSMARTDPHGYAVDAVQLAMSMVREDKAFAVIGFGHLAETRVPWMTFGDDVSARNEARDILSSEIRQDGHDTLYALALSTAIEKLTQRNAPRGTRVLFFTDGDARDDPAEILAQAHEMAERGWIIDGLLLNTGSEGRRDDLRQIVRITRGTVQEVANAEELIEAFLLLVRADNDTFGYEMTDWREAREVTVPAGAHQLTWLVARRPVRRITTGHLLELSVDGRLVDIAHSSVFRYPYPGAEEGHRNRMEITAIRNPSPGIWSAVFDGEPLRVYVNISMGMRFEPLQIPSSVEEGETLTLGLGVYDEEGRRVRHVDQLDRLSVRSTITNQTDGSIVSQNNLPLQVDDQHGVRFAAQWQARLPDKAERGFPHPVSVVYDLLLDDQYHLAKLDAFVINTAAQPIPKQVVPQLAWSSERLDFPPTWLGEEVRSMLRVDATGSGGPIRYESAMGFEIPEAVPVPVTDYEVEVRFQSESPGVAVARLEPRSESADDLSVAVLPILRAYNYPWNGEDALSFEGVGGRYETPLLEWLGGSDEKDLPPQALRAHEIVLQHVDAENIQSVDLMTAISMQINSDGTAQVVIPPRALPGQYHAETKLHYGELRPRDLLVSYKYKPPKAHLYIVQGDVDIVPGKEWKPGTWAERTVALSLEGGAPGDISVQVSDLNGPDGDALSAAYDVRVTLDTDVLHPDKDAVLNIRVIRPRDILPGTYSGTVYVTYTPDPKIGEPVEFNYPVTVEVP